MVNEDIAMQFGQLPPCFLPFGNKRLFSVQAEIALGEPCAITLPEDFVIPEIDQKRLNEKGLMVIPQSRKMRLTQAIGHALTQIKPTENLRILYGDTLVRMEPKVLHKRDMVAVRDTTSNFPWAFVKADSGNGIRFSDAPPKRLNSRQIVCGYYNFSDPDLLATACHETSIVKALNFYSARQPLNSVVADQWLDFGHLSLYLQSKKYFLIKRSFNDLVYENQYIVKQSNDTQKIRAEANWYSSLPSALQLHVPRYQGKVERNYRAGYAVEYLYKPLLSDVSVFGNLPLASWLEIISACFEFVKKCHDIRPQEGTPEASPHFAATFYSKLVVDKTRSRLEEFCSSTKYTLDDVFTINDVQFPPIKEIIEDLVARIDPTQPDHIRFWHGDLFFGNMFYDFTANRVFCIDPRGQIDAGEFSIFGDLRYDLAKLSHSIIGQYDKLVLGRSYLVEEEERHWRFTIDQQKHQGDIEQIFTQFLVETCNVNVSEILALTSLLFFSMLPLHYDRPDLQRQFLAMGMQIWKKIK